MTEAISSFLRGVAWGDWADPLKTVLHVALILALAWVALLVSSRLIRTLREYVTRQQGNREDVKRVETLGRVFRYIASVVISVIAGLLILGELGISIAPILGAAGVVGIAVGFGAQSLVRDYFNGFFLLVENQLRQGDVVNVAGIGGLVEEVTLRFVRLRDYDGNVHFVPNGMISTVSNMSRGFAQSVIDVGVAYREDLDEVFTVMREVAGGMRRDPIFAAKILEDVEIAGVEKWADSAVTLRCRIKVLPLEQWNVRREYLRRLKHAFDERGIEIPYPHLTIYAGQDKRGLAPPFRTVSVRPAEPVRHPQGTGAPANE
ncbi:MAG TPA: mechanosensitive ion channel family protein [Burkholderiales bacterium]|nr:mechanosensitive ion channel family protein [Burkholderiales bacterium]